MVFKAVYGAFGVIGIALGGGGARHIIGIPPPAEIVHGLICLSLCAICSWGACYLWSISPVILDVLASDKPYATKAKTIQTILGPFLKVSDSILAMHKIAGGK
jgi:hypothetical protein